VDMDQDDYRSVMSFRDRLARGEFGAERYREDAATASAGGGGGGETAADGGTTGDDGAFKRAVREEFGLTDLRGANEDTVEDALEILANGREAEAAERLTDRFESVCETDAPGRHGDAQIAACHLYRDDLRESEDGEPSIEDAFGGTPQGLDEEAVSLDDGASPGDGASSGGEATSDGDESSDSPDGGDQ
jgi:peptide/nickel transport system ATP-binding protein